MREDDFIVSKTDARGVILYGNPIFVEFSGYSEAELLGSPHSIIRHPDMPRAAFKLAWDTIQKGDEFFGFVKNLAKDGSFYWVFAHITPDYDATGQIVGYTSVRRCPPRSALPVVERIYAQVREAEMRVPRDQQVAAGTEKLMEILEREGVSYGEFIFALL